VSEQPGSSEGFKDLSPEQLERRFAALGTAALERFGISAEAPLTLLSHRENAVFRVDDPGADESYVLRIHREDYQTEDMIRSELAWMEVLRAEGVETPEVIRARDGDTVQTVEVPEVPEPRHCDLFRWVGGEPPDAGDIGRTYRLLGQVNARIHRQVRAWKRPPGFHRQSWDEDGMLGEDPLWGRFTDLAALSPEQLGLLGDAKSAVLTRLARFGKAPDRFGLIHADLMAENILVKDGVPRVIDFDDSGFGWNLYDPATLLAFDVAEDDFERKRDAWVEGYRSVAPLPDAHLEELPTLIMARFLVALGWLHTRRETPFAREFTPGVVALSCSYAGEFIGGS
jgi:Ser/Thr protein kinase RdoA (MazF antagonist)